MPSPLTLNYNVECSDIRQTFNFNWFLGRTKQQPTLSVYSMAYDFMCPAQLVFYLVGRHGNYLLVYFRVNAKVYGQLKLTEEINVRGPL